MNTLQSPRHRPFVTPQLPAPPMHRVAVDNAWLEHSEVRRAPYCDGTAVLRDRARELGVEVLPTGEPHAFELKIEGRVAPGSFKAGHDAGVFAATTNPLRDESSMWASRYHQSRRQLSRSVWGFVAVLGALVGLVLALHLMGCSSMDDPTVPDSIGCGSSSGESGEAESGTSGSGSGSSGLGSGGGSGESDSSGGNGSDLCQVEGLECLCAGEVSDPFECVDECVWLDGNLDQCYCDDQTAPREWCELATCVLEGVGTELLCLCAGLSTDPLACVTDCEMVADDVCHCDGQTVPTEWCDL